MTDLRKRMLEELQRRNYSATTTQYYLRIVEQAKAHDGLRRRVHASLSGSCSTQRFCPYPALRSAGQSLPIGVHRFGPETLGDGAAGPVTEQRGAKSAVVMPAMSGSSDRHKTDRCPTFLETLIEQLRRLLIAGLSLQPCDVLSHA